MSICSYLLKDDYASSDIARIVDDFTIFVWTLRRAMNAMHLALATSSRSCRAICSQAPTTSDA